MSELLIIAYRNLVRHKRRSLVAFLAVGLGALSLVMASGFMEWIFWAMRESVIQSQFGHLQITREGFREYGTARPFEYLVKDRDIDVRSIESEAGVVALNPRRNLVGLISRGETTVSFIGEGVDPVSDAIVNKHVFILEGETLDQNTVNGIIMGQGLARIMGAQVGDTVALLVSTADSGLNAAEVTILGLFFTASKAYDDSAIRAHIGLVTELLRSPGVHQWQVLLTETRQTDNMLSRVKQLTEGTGLQVDPWYDLADTYNKTVRLFGRQLLVVKIIVLVIILLGITNTMMRNVMERTGEIGTLMALGFRPSRVMNLFMLEGAMIGILGGGGGVLLGWAGAEVISYIGIPMPPPPGLDVRVTGEIHVDTRLALSTLVLIVASTLVASIYPAWKAARLPIVDALRQARQ